VCVHVCVHVCVCARVCVCVWIRVHVRTHRTSPYFTEHGFVFFLAPINMITAPNLEIENERH